MRFSFVLSILGQQFALASAPDDEAAAEELVAVASDMELFGFAGGSPVDPEYFEEVEPECAR